MDLALWSHYCSWRSGRSEIGHSSKLSNGFFVKGCLVDTVEKYVRESVSFEDTYIVHPIFSAYHNALKMRYTRVSIIITPSKHFFVNSVFVNLIPSPCRMKKTEKQHDPNRMPSFPRQSSASIIPWTSANISTHHQHCFSNQNKRNREGKYGKKLTSLTFRIRLALTPFSPPCFAEIAPSLIKSLRKSM